MNNLGEQKGQESMHGGMPKSLHDVQLLQVLQEHAKGIERLAWKHNDSEEFAEGQLRMLKSMAGLGYGVKKSVLRRTLPHAKLSLSNAEGELFIEKVHSAFSYIKRKLRNRGSGLHLPMACNQILKVWSRIGKEKKMRNKSSDETLQLGKADVKHVEQSPTPIMEQRPKHIRETLGIPPKKAGPLVSLLSDDDDDDAAPELLEEEEEEEEEEVHDGFSPTQGAQASGSASSTQGAQASGSASSTSALPSGSYICGLHAEDWENSKYCLNFCPQNFTDPFPKP